MKVKRKDIHIDHAVGNGIDQPMLLVDASAPLALQRASQRLGLANAGENVTTEILTVRNATVTAEGSERGSIKNFKTLTLEGCSITSPAGAVWNGMEHVVCDASGNVIKTQVTIAPGATSVPVTGVTVNPTSLNLEVDHTDVLTATVEPADATDKSLTWSSSDESVATVDGSGTVKGIAPGTAIITVETADGNKTATATVTVKEASTPIVMVSSITLNHTLVTINGDQEEVQLVATVAPDDATDKSLTWSSNTPAVASVGATGLVTIHKKGKATITVTANDGSGIVATCQVEVLSTVGNVAIDGLRIYASGGQLHLTLPQAETVRIYNLSGALMKTLALPAGDTSLALPQGVYIVRVGERTTKVMVK